MLRAYLLFEQVRMTHTALRGSWVNWRHALLCFMQEASLDRFLEAGTHPARGQVGTV